VTVAVESSERRRLADLRRRHEANRLEMAVIEQTEALRAYRRSRISDALEGYYDPTNYVDIRDYLGLNTSVPAQIARATTIEDRQDGRNLPIFQTEMELAVYRGLSRVLAACNEVATGIVEKLTDYTIGCGFSYRVHGDGELAKNASAVLDGFLDRNDWVGDLDCERFQRRLIDGEYFLGLWHIGNGEVEARIIEPDQVTEPTAKRDIEDWLGCPNPSSWSFGVHTEAEDVEDVHGYWVKWSHRQTDWDYLPGGKLPIFPPAANNVWVEHAKANVTRNVKRGIGDFFATRETLERARKVLRNVGEGAAVQAAIAFFREHDTGVAGSKVLAMLQANAARSYQRTFDSGSRTGYIQQFDAGTIVDHGRGVQYKYGPMGQNNAPVYLEVFQAMLRSAATRWSMPEYMMTTDASNANYASTLIAESPFVRRIERIQRFFVRSDLRVLWRVLWFAWRAGRFGQIAWETLKQKLSVEIEPPPVAVRDKAQDTNRNKILHDSGVLSKRRWADRENLDYDREVEDGAGQTRAAPAIGVAGQPAEDPAVAKADQDVQVARELVLNGAQIAAATEIVTNVATGVIPRDTGLGQLKVLFNLTDSQANQIMGSAGTGEPTTPNPQPDAAAADVSESLRESRAWRLVRSLFWGR